MDLVPFNFRDPVFSVQPTNPKLGSTECLPEQWEVDFKTNLKTYSISLGITTSHDLLCFIDRQDTSLKDLLKIDRRHVGIRSLQIGIGLSRSEEEPAYHVMHLLVFFDVLFRFSLAKRPSTVSFRFC
ncbi:hypothetical protein L596_021520 [Steinernema carpocapsae]|uniref:Uncharacterized protein n=1 Tax=Steinernema carpocapsae TaxID=34508 RepID=A0A4U5MJ05_STECR|nr:hypothetical protein L596_021520 [Steinernema carpocapsae]